MINGRQAPWQRRSTWIAQMVTIAGLVVYALLIAWAWPPGQSVTGVSSAVGALLALVPTLLWLLLFYAQDSREPEPIGYVLRVAGAGALIGFAFAIPALGAVRATLGWGVSTGLASLVVMIGVVGSIYSFAVYAAVRYTVLDTGELDEPGDGIVYGTAAGVGVAAAVNVWLMVSSSDVQPLPAALRIVVVALAQGAFGGIVGYGLGSARLLGEGRRAVTGFAVAAVLNGVFTYLLRELTQDGLQHRPWNGLFVAAAVAAATTTILLRVVHASPHRSGVQGSRVGAGGATRVSWFHLDVPIWAVACVLFVTGWLVLGTTAGRTTTFSDGGGRLKIQYPASWLPTGQREALLEVYDPQSGGAVHTGLLVTRGRRDPTRSLSALARDRAVARSRSSPMYRVLTDTATTVAGHDAVATEYAYVDDPHVAVLAATRLPVVVRGIEFVVPSGDVLYYIELKAAEPVYARARARFVRMISEARL